MRLLLRQSVFPSLWQLASLDLAP